MPEERDGAIIKALSIFIFTVPVLIPFIYLIYRFISKRNIKTWIILLVIGVLGLILSLFDRYWIFKLFLSYKEHLYNIFSKNSFIEGLGVYFMFPFDLIWLIIFFGVPTGLLIRQYRDNRNAYLERFNATLRAIGSSEAPIVPKSAKALKTQNDANSTIIGSTGNRTVTINDNAKHIFVCGTTGSGKTVLLSNFIESGIDKDYPMVIIDGKGDINEGSLLEIIKSRKGNRKLYVINLSDTLKSAKYNPFKNASGTVIKDMLISMSDWSEEHYKQNTERYIQRLTFILEKMEIPFSFETLKKYIDKVELMQLSNEGVKKDVFTKEEHTHSLDIINTCGEIAMNAAARFVTMAESELGKLFDNDGIDIESVVDENSIILFVLNPLLYQELSPRIGQLVLIDIKRCVSHLFKERKDRVFFIFDEISSYISPLFIDLLNKSRSANVTCISATQSLSDLDFNSGEAFKEQIIENCNNYVVLRQNSAKNAEAWANILGTRENMDITYQFGDEGVHMSTTGKGSAKITREYLYHPDLIKSLKTGEAVYMSKDEGVHYQIKVRKGDYI